MPEVPDVKYMRNLSVLLVGTLSQTSEHSSISLSKSSHPSLCPLTMNLQASLSMLPAPSKDSTMSSSSVTMAALRPAASILYSMSWGLSMNVAGTAMAPILWSATQMNQNW